VRQSPGGSAAAAILQALPAGVREHVLGAARYVRVRPGGFFYRQGDAGTRCYMLGRGEVRLTWTNTGGQQVLLRTLGPGEWFGDVCALADGIHRSAAVAAQDSEAAAWDAPLLFRLMRQHPAFMIEMVQQLARRFEEFVDRFEATLTDSAERRAARTLLQAAHATLRSPGEPHLEVRLSHDDLADMIGVSPYTASRILSRWTKAGIIGPERRRGRIAIRSLDQLLRLVE
jgi:CRP-like cAMP-binding protein